MTSSIMHSCDESDDSLRITNVEVEVDPIISPFDFHFRTFVTWLRENYDYRNVSWEMICIYDLTLSKWEGGGVERNTCSFEARG